MGQMTIGEMLTALKVVDNNARVEFLTAYDTLAKMKGAETAAYFLNGGFGSYRGYYRDLHIGYSLNDKGMNTVGNLKATLRKALAQGEMHGYKGGEFPINEHTVVWLALDYGNCSGLFIQDVVTDTADAVTILLGEDR